jgi:peptidoglycan L-alanyl-D-glutamate endopeptidase CwlK
MSKEDVQRDVLLLKPELQNLVRNIEIGIIQYHNLPLKVFETKRTLERQEWLFEQGYSKTLNSRHLDGSAVDFVYYKDGKWSWDNGVLHYYHFLGERVKELFGNRLMWGKDFINLTDLPHFELKK